MQSIQMQLSTKPIIFVQPFSTLLNSTGNFERFQKIDEPHS